MSESQAQVSDAHMQVLPKKPVQFPAAWLVNEPHDAPVVDFTLWNRVKPTLDNPYRTQFDTNWDATITAPYFLPADASGVAIGPTFIRHYFGLQGCIIPIATCTTCLKPSLFFTLAEPAVDGKKTFYVYTHDQDCVEGIKLCCVGRFASMDEFYRRVYCDEFGDLDPCFKPVVGGQEAAKKELEKCGYWLPEEEFE